MQAYTPTNWFWVIGGDQSRAWSSAAGGYVSSYPTDRLTRIASEADLSEVLRPYGLAGPRPTADDVRAEAQRRIIALTGTSDLIACMIKQSNANMRANEFNDKRLRGEKLTAAEDAEAAALRSLADKIKAIRVASNVMEPAPPADYKADSRWPA